MALHVHRDNWQLGGQKRCKDSVEFPPFSCWTNETWVSEIGDPIKASGCSQCPFCTVVWARSDRTSRGQPFDFMRRRVLRWVSGHLSQNDHRPTSLKKPKGSTSWKNYDILWPILGCRLVIRPNFEPYFVRTAVWFTVHQLKQWHFQVTSDWLGWGDKFFLLLKPLWPLQP